MRCDDLLAGGFIITRPVPRPDYVSAALLPSSILSASGCIAKSLHDDLRSLYSPDSSGPDPAEEAAEWGLSPTRIREIKDWFSVAFEDGRVGWPGYFKSLRAARDFVDWLREPLNDALILGLGLDPDQREEFLERETVPGGGDHALVASIRAEARFPAGGRLLGWEVLGHEYGGELHSWLCSGCEVDANDRLGIRPNLLGLIEDGPQADEVATLINGEELGEPVDYWAWGIVQFSLHAP